MIKVGEIYETNNYGTLEVIQYVNSKKVRVRFIDTGHERYTTSGRIRTGMLKDPFVPSVYGVGYLGSGIYKASTNGSNTKVYATWKGMLERCYSDALKRKHPTYTGCYVVKDWHNFQVFAAWFTDNYIEG